MHRRDLIAWIAGLMIGLLASASYAAPVAPSSASSPPAGFRRSPLLDKFLQGPLAGIDEIVFAVRVPGRDHWYVNFGNYSNDDNKDKAHKFEDGVYWGYGDG